MKIGRCCLFRYDLPLVAPLEVKSHTLDVRSGLLIRLADDGGTEGWGEVAPLVGMSHETPEQAQQQVVHLRDALVGINIPDEHFTDSNEQPLLPILNDCVSSVRWGVEQALWNLYAARQDMPLHHLLAQHPREQASINGLLTGSIGDLLRAAQRMREDGFKAVKLKVGRRALHDDIALTQQVREVIGDDIELRLDANRAWNWETALNFSQAIADCDIAYIEEPLADATQLRRFVDMSPLPVALDETLSDVPLNELDRFAGVAAFVLKPSLLGGISTALRLARKAEELQAVAVFSSLFETGLTITTLAQLAATLTQDVPTGLDTYRWLREDVLQTRLEMHAGRLALPSLYPRMKSGPSITNTLKRVA